MNIASDIAQHILIPGFGLMLLWIVCMIPPMLVTRRRATSYLSTWTCGLISSIGVYLVSTHLLDVLLSEWVLFTYQMLAGISIICSACVVLGILLIRLIKFLATAIPDV